MEKEIKFLTDEKTGTRYRVEVIEEIEKEPEFEVGEITAPARPDFDGRYNEKLLETCRKLVREVLEND